MDQVQELSETELYRYLDELLQIERRESVKNINQSALSSAAGQGGKKAISQIKKITKEFEREEKSKENKQKFQGGAGKLVAPRLNDEDLKLIIEGNQNGRSENP